MMRRGREEMLKLLVWQCVIAAVVGIGVAVCILAFLPFGFFSSPLLTYQYDHDLPISNSTWINSSSSCESMETINLLKSQVRQLSEELKVAKQQEHNVVPKAGPFGTVKAPRTNPTVLPDETLNPKLANILSNIAINKELIVALANSNVKPMLQLWFTSIKRVGISNYLVVALDDETLHFCKSNNVPVYKRDPDEAIDSVGRTGGTLVVSGLKFTILREFLQLGYNVLLSDTDIIYVQNPFDHLYRDSDVESMSDGHDVWSAYGYNDVFDDPVMQWSRYVYTTRFGAYNSGFFYIRATIASIELLDRVADSLAQRPGDWDQAIFNEELFFNSRPGYVGLHAAKRTMDIYLFMNSKILFKYVRKDPILRKEKPVIVHVNYHPDKLPRMKAVYEFYVNGKDDALDNFSVGTPRTN